ncbi:dihydroneopterin aldolase [Vigna unguiculata]|uniref:7,8-dihydroneopterin aldolase n=2 Tax=Vigna unguiculata TaxID=3917 RepID=A0A4D6MEB8_VIGUN|nr:dihydroneopterin aldolase [Vigna unguiculata]
MLRIYTLIWIHKFDDQSVVLKVLSSSRFLSYQLKEFLRAKMESDALTWGDKLVLRGLSFYGFHGAKPEERKLGQKFVVDIDAWMDLAAAGKTDHLSDTVSYTTIYDIAKEVLEGSPHNLLESVAQKIAIATMTNHKEILAVRVKVGKPHVAVRGPVEYLGVEIYRRRSDLSA